MSMKQYGLEARYVDVLTADAARPAWTQRSPLFDAIVTDRKTMIDLYLIN